MEMYKCLIVEDEALARYAFRAFALKNFPQIEVVGEAETGFEAIEVFHKTMPDVVVMDIRIPGKSGLEVSKELLNLKPDIKIVILTAYEDLDYMHRALALGVSGYLLKPLDKEEARVKLNKILEEIYSNKRQRQVETQMEQQKNFIRPYIQRELVDILALGNFDLHKVDSYIRFLQLQFNAGYFTLFSFEKISSCRMDIFSKNLVDFNKIELLVEDHLSRFKKCIFGKPVGNMMIILFPLEHCFNIDDTIREAKMIGCKLHHRILLNLQIDACIGIGSPYIGLDNLKFSFREAYHAVRNASPSEPVIHYSNVKNVERCILMTQQLIEEEVRFAEYIRIGHIDKAKIRFEALLQLVFYKFTTLWELQEYLIGLFSMMQRLLNSLGKPDPDLHNLLVVETLKQFDSSGECRRWVQLIMHSVLDRLKNCSESKEASHIQSVRSFIDEKFCTDISLEAVADKIGLTPQYVSKLFKEEYGVNFVEYVTKKRMDYAKELLKNRGSPLKEISNILGYVDTNYFCRLFKKHTGFSPKQYQNRFVR